VLLGRTGRLASLELLIGGPIAAEKDAIVSLDVPPNETRLSADIRSAGARVADRQPNLIV
jgi:hypothetical protein